MSYELLKTIHILGAILLLGNITVSAWWKVMANRTGDARIIAFAQCQVMRTDILFTLPGAVMIVVTGDFIGYVLYLNSWSIQWLSWGRILFIASGLIWLFVLIPIQVKQIRLSRAFAAGSEIPPAYWRLNRYWYAFGAIAGLLPTANLYWMVFKPI